MTSNQPPPKTPRPVGLWLLLAALCIGGGGLWWWAGQRPGVPGAGEAVVKNVPDEKKTPVAIISRQECLRLIELKNLGVGYLENNDYGKAEKILVELAAKLPDDPVGVRNLAIARILGLTGGLVPEGLDAALELDQKMEPDSPAPYVLAAAKAEVERNEAEAVLNLDRATERAPTDVALWYRLFSISRYAQDPAVQARAVPALKKAYELDPDNLFLLTEWLGVQAEGKDPKIVETLKAARTLVQPVVESVRQVARVNVLNLIDEATAAATKGKWGELRGPVQRLNVIRSQDWVQSDLRRLRQEPLASILHYVVREFRPGVCDPHDVLKPDESSSTPFKFARFPDKAQLPESPTGVIDMNLSDFDLDSRPDVTALTAKTIQVFSRPENSKPWERIAQLELGSEMRGLLAGDLDRDVIKSIAPAAPEKPEKGSDPHKVKHCHDADPDFVLFGAGGATVYRNELDEKTGKRSLVPVEQVPEFQAQRDILAGVLVDFDQDGDLDVVFSRKAGIALWANQGDMQFIDRTQRSTLPPAGVQATTLVAVDWDRDLDLDIMLSGPASEPAGYLENLRHGQFRWQAFSGKLADLSGARWMDLLDADANGSWDLISYGDQGAKIVTTAADIAAGIVTGTDSTVISKQLLKRGLIWDFDNDSYFDLAAWGETGLVLFQGAGGARFDAAAKGIPEFPKTILACAAADLDLDGAGDLVVAGADGVVLYRNQSENKNHWLDVRIRGEDGDKSGRVNHMGIGSLLELKSGPFYRQQVVTGSVTHFGLGSRTTADVVRVVWTNGVPQTILQPGLNQLICEVHAVKTSCPYLYTWTGKKFEFITDLLWAAPMGLQFAEGVYAQPRDWEYLKIDGERLRPRNGKYALQITEELWEASYFDCVRLIAVDHPADVEIYSNEKVGPADLAEFKVHTVQTPRTPVAARDRRGNDVLETVRRKDGVYMKGFERNLRQGLTEEHFLELDLGDLASAKQITLFLTGWIYPTDTTLNVAISQNPRMTPPRPPAVWVPDAQGAWKEVRPYMGFPGGKTKTIAVDLSGLFLTKDYRVRIVTNMEFYWDEAFFTADEQPASIKLNPLSVKSADLHYRGFSAPRWDPGFGPTTYDYASVSTAPQWPPMRGAFTRFGPVAPLLTEEDDRFVVIGAGDELTLEFDVPADPPAGWKRDFLIYNVGWDKDADLHTIYGQDVGPLPFRAMSGYPYTASESYPDDPFHRRYLEEYQTRHQPQEAFWRRLMMPD